LLGGTSDARPGSPYDLPLRSTTVTSNEVFTDGVLLLAQEYLEPTFGGYVSL
jgi:hypothetical protein